MSAPRNISLERLLELPNGERYIVRPAHELLDDLNEREMASELPADQVDPAHDWQQVQPQRRSKAG